MILGEPAVDTQRVVRVQALELTLAQRPWAFAERRRAEIDAHFAMRCRTQPALWNGQVLLMHRHRLEGGLLQGAFLQTDFASFLAWRDWGFPEAGAINCFSMGALRASDGAWLLGVAAAHTATAGSIYFPAGTPDPDDVADGTVDLAGSVAREVHEETGLGPADFRTEQGWHCVLAGRRMSLMKVLQAHEPAEVLRGRILDHVSGQSVAELSDIRIVRHRRDLDPMMPSFMTVFLEFMWS